MDEKEWNMRQHLTRYQWLNRDSARTVCHRKGLAFIDLQLRAATWVLSSFYKVQLRFRTHFCCPRGNRSPHANNVNGKVPRTNFRIYNPLIVVAFFVITDTVARHLLAFLFSLESLAWKRVLETLKYLSIEYWSNREKNENSLLIRCNLESNFLQTVIWIRRKKQWQSLVGPLKVRMNEILFGKQLLNAETHSQSFPFPFCLSVYAFIQQQMYFMMQVYTDNLTYKGTRPEIWLSKEVLHFIHSFSGQCVRIKQSK